MTVPPIVQTGFPALPLPMSPGYGQMVPGLPPPSLVTQVLPSGQAVIVPGHIPAVALQPLAQVPLHPVPPSVGLPAALGQAMEPVFLPGDPAYQVQPPSSRVTGYCMNRVLTVAQGAVCLHRGRSSECLAGLDVASSLPSTIFCCC